MNNTDLINQMNQITQNLANQSLYYTEECSRPATETETMVFIVITGFFILLTLGVLVWGF
jgi:hypothetical protein